MKVVVDKQLRGGVYFVKLIVGEFTDDERQRFVKFGVPTVTVMHGTPAPQQQPPQAAFPRGRVVVTPQQPGRQSISCPVTNIGDHFVAGFTNPDEANAYEQRIVAEIKQKMELLRNQKDNFSSTQEVDI